MNIDLEENDILEIEETLYEYMDEYMTSEILQLSSTTFYEDGIEDITNILHEYWVDCRLCEDEDYDEVQDIVETVFDAFLENSHIPRREYAYPSLLETEPTDLDLLANKIQSLKNVEQPAQRTKEWYEFRYELITASNIWKALGSDAQKNSLIYEKCKPLSSQNDFSTTNIEGALHWGVKYEPLTVMIYEHMYHTKIDDFGCIRHPTYSFIGASPDGINADLTNTTLYGRMIEIKNIYNREITGVPKDEYWIQTQVQMETCDLEECDFVETRFKEYETAELFYDDASVEYKGVALFFMKKTAGLSKDDLIKNKHSMNTPVYKYMPLDQPLDKHTVDQWIALAKDEYKDELVLFSTLYWYLDEFSCVLIKRNREWFRAALPKIEETWNTILQERVSGYQHRASKKRSVKTEVLVEKQDQSKSQIIRNLPLSNSICLVKLDGKDEQNVAISV